MLDKMKRKTKILWMLSSIALSGLFVGCESFTTGTNPAKKKKKDASSWFTFKKKEYQIPQSMNVTWTHDVLTLAGKPPTRGFGGRFYFYNEKTQAIPVDGDLVVYGFDDTLKKHSAEDLSQADKRFRFTAEQFTTHFSEGQLGASYSVWIPWDEAYGDQKKIMLLPTFMTKDGRLIRGSASSLNLPGKAIEGASSSVDPSVVQQASASKFNVMNGQMADGTFIRNGMVDSRNVSHNHVADSMRTTTIQVPANSLKRPVLNTNNDFNADAAEAFARQHMASQQAQLAQSGMGQDAQTPLTGASLASFQSAPSIGPIDSASSTGNNGSNQTVGSSGSMPNFINKSSNAWGLPVFAPNQRLISPANHSAPSSPQAQALQAVQPASYPSR
jgi:hypothetical protein